MFILREVWFWKKNWENGLFHMLCSRRLQECNVFHPALVLHIKSDKSIVCKCYYNFVKFWMVKDMTDCPSLILLKLLDVALITITLRIPKLTVYRLSLTAFRVKRSSQNSKVSVISPLEVQYKICLAQNQLIT